MTSSELESLIIEYSPYDSISTRSSYAAIVARIICLCLEQNVDWQKIFDRKFGPQQLKALRNEELAKITCELDERKRNLGYRVFIFDQLLTMANWNELSIGHICCCFREERRITIGPTITTDSHPELMDAIIKVGGFKRADFESWNQLKQ